MIFTPASDKIYQWVEKFKAIFINQEASRLSEIFDIENFGLHNGVDLYTYTQYEFDEFALKCEKFELTMQAQIVACELQDDFFYFSLGKQEDKALFEAIFKFKGDIAIGNQYRYRIEPKLQFFKEKNTITSQRRINIKGPIKVKSILNAEPSDNNSFISTDLDEVLGGYFYSSIYNRLNEDNLSFWDKISIVSERGIIKHDVLMRGIDHPVFRDDLFPVIDGKTVTYDKKIYPVIVYVVLESGREHYFKYPKDNTLFFDESVIKVCLTDTLSYDWVVSL